MLWGAFLRRSRWERRLDAELRLRAIGHSAWPPSSPWRSALAGFYFAVFRWRCGPAGLHRRRRPHASLRFHVWRQLSRFPPQPDGLLGGDILERRQRLRSYLRRTHPASVRVRGIFLSWDAGNRSGAWQKLYRRGGWPQQAED